MQTTDPAAQPPLGGGNAGTVSTPFRRSHARLIVLLAVPLQLVALYVVPLVYECDAAVYYHYSVASTYRAPLFPALLLATGQHHLNTFAGTVLAHAAFGVVSPLLVHRTLAPLTPSGALAAALIYVLSLVPFTAAKLMLAEQLFTVVVLSAVYCLSRYWFTGERRYVYLTFAAGLGAMFTRWEGQFLLAFCALAVLIRVASRARPHLKAWVTCMVVTGLICVGWSFYRATVMKDMRVFGTLQNGTAEQLFWGISIAYMGPEIYQWERAVDPALDEQRRSEPAEAATRYHLIQPDNGPATRELADTIRRIARTRPAEEIFGAQMVKPGGGFLTRLGGDPERLVSEVFQSLENTYLFSVPSELRRELGPHDAERLLIAVNMEAIQRHPMFIVSRLAVALTFVGVAIDPGYLAGYRQGTYQSPLMRLWGEMQYGDVPFDLGGCATGSLPPRMIAEYRWDRGLPRSPERFVRFMSIGRNVLRNAVGPLFLVSLIFLFFAPSRGFFATVAISTIAIIGVVAALGGSGAHTRYEYPVLPLLLVVTAGGVLGAHSILSRLRSRVSVTTVSA